MYITIVLFFTSLIGIIFMLGRKLLMLQNGEILVTPYNETENLYFKELKQITIQKIKRYCYLVLVETIRFYVKSTNIIKYKYETIIIKIHNNKNTEKQEMSKFLKSILNYKNKIRDIKKEIQEEEVEKKL